MTSIATELGQTTVNEIVTNMPRIGGLDCPGDEFVAGTFHGARVCKGNTVVNECVAISFDPATLVCVVCETPHSILNEDGSPVAVIVSDQNFVPVITNSNRKKCVPVIRLENASLCELSDLLTEIFDPRRPLPPGSVAIIGSASFLYRSGSATYASAWLDIVGKLAKRFRNVHIAPLTPIVRESCP